MQMITSVRETMAETPVQREPPIYVNDKSYV